VRTSVAAHSKDEVTIQARVVNDEDEVCATATMGLPLGPLLALPELAAYPAAPLPAERPVATRAHLAGHTILGSPELLLERSVIDAFLTRVTDTLPVPCAFVLSFQEGRSLSTRLERATIPSPLSFVTWILAVEFTVTAPLTESSLRPSRSIGDGPPTFMLTFP